MFCRWHPEFPFNEDMIEIYTAIETTTDIDDIYREESNLSGGAEVPQGNTIHKTPST